MKPPQSANCEPDFDIHLDITEDIRESFQAPISESSSSSFEYVSSSDSKMSPDISDEAEVCLEDCSVTYFSGYLAKVCIAKFNCEQCKLELITKKDLDNKKELLILYKTYENVNVNDDSGLKTPSRELQKVVDISLKVFEENINDLYFKNNLKKLLLKQILRKIKKKTMWLDKCKEHRLFVIQHLIVCKIFSFCKLIARGESRDVKEHPKLRILKHK